MTRTLPARRHFRPVSRRALSITAALAAAIPLTVVAAPTGAAAGGSSSSYAGAPSTTAQPAGGSSSSRTGLPATTAQPAGGSSSSRTGLPAATAQPAGGSSSSRTGLPAATAQASGVDLGRSGLPETRRATRVVPGVTVTSIVRGNTPATPANRGTTPNGPWRIQVATIDRGAKGQLRTAIGADIARTEGVSTLARWSKSHVAVNGSFFSQSRRTAPGDMVGVAVNNGMIISHPQRVAGHVGVLMDSATKNLRMDNYTWKSTLTGENGEELFLQAVNTVVAVPKGCEQMTDFTRCATAGPIIRFTPHWAARTPSGPGAEVVYDRQGCVVSAKRTRGVALRPNQTSVQATGSAATELLRVAGTGCPTYRENLFGSDRQRVEMTNTTFGVTGRYRLVRDGQIVAPTNRGAFFDRHPRTIIGRTAGGSVMLVTVDGRSTRSVGVTLTEAARLAKSLGMVDAANLDGGGSTAMAVKGRLVNTPAGGRERSVGDAVVFMP